jgi:hypothetical protein
VLITTEAPPDSPWKCRGFFQVLQTPSHNKKAPFGAFFYSSVFDVSKILFGISTMSFVVSVEFG